jgi:hypothetical protein
MTIIIYPRETSQYYFNLAFLWQISPQTNLVSAFVFGIIGTAGFALFGCDTATPKLR